MSFSLQSLIRDVLDAQNTISVWGSANNQYEEAMNLGEGNYICKPRLDLLKMLDELIKEKVVVINSTDAYMSRKKPLKEIGTALKFFLIKEGLGYLNDKFEEDYDNPIWYQSDSFRSFLKELIEDVGLPHPATDVDVIDEATFACVHSGISDNPETGEEEWNFRFLPKIDNYLKKLVYDSKGLLSVVEK